MKYYLLSGMNMNNEFFPDIAKVFKKDFKEIDTIVYIPTYPDNEEKCEKLAKKNIFKNIGIDFKKYIVLNNSYSSDDIKEIIKNNKLFFLYGGDPYKQIEFIKQYNITLLIKNKFIIGLSAGSINMCRKAICTKDEDFDFSNMYDGMGLIDFSIEPHFNYNNVEVLADLKKFSKDTDIYALEDDAYIIVENEMTNFYREYLFDSRWQCSKARATIVTLAFAIHKILMYVG